MGFNRYRLKKVHVFLESEEHEVPHIQHGCYTHYNHFPVDIHCKWIRVISSDHSVMETRFHSVHSSQQVASITMATAQLRSSNHSEQTSNRITSSPSHISATEHQRDMGLVSFNVKQFCLRPVHRCYIHNKCENYEVVTLWKKVLPQQALRTISPENVSCYYSLTIQKLLLHLHVMSLTTVLYC